MAIELHHLGLHNTFALYRHQGGGKAEWHAHLELGRLARLVALFLGQQVDAVVVITTKPKLALLGDIYGRRGLDAVARAVFGGNHQLHLTGFVQRGFTEQQAASVALAGADATQFLHRGLVVIGVEATDHALARGGDNACGGFDLHRHIGLRLAREV